MSAPGTVEVNCDRTAVLRAERGRSAKYLLRAAAVAWDAVEEGPVDARDVVDERGDLEPQHRGRLRRRLPAGPEGGRRLLLLRVLCLRAHMGRS